MARELKTIMLRSFRDEFSGLNSCILLDHRGLNAEQTVDLRRTLRATGARVRVVHNRLLKQALRELPQVPPGFAELLRGPTAVIYGMDAPSATKAYDRWRKRNQGAGVVKGGLLEGRVLSHRDVEQLARLPDHETLQAAVSAMMLSPVSLLSSAVESLLAHFAGCVEARREELGGDADGAS